jgi:hypothetical protein
LSTAFALNRVRRSVADPDIDSARPGERADLAAARQPHADSEDASVASCTVEVSSLDAG